MTPSDEPWRKFPYEALAQLADVMAHRLFQWRTTGLFGETRLKPGEADAIGDWLADIEIELERRRDEHAGSSRLSH